MSKTGPTGETPNLPLHNVVETSLADALRAAVAQGRWDVAEQIVQELKRRSLQRETQTQTQTHEIIEMSDAQRNHSKKSA